MSTTQRKFLNHYLGFFWPRTIPTSEDARFCAAKVKNGDFYAEGPEEFLRIVGSYYLLNWGRKSWSLKRTYDFVEDYLDKQEEGGSLTTDTEGTLCILHVKNTMNNKQLDNMVLHVLENRRIKGLATCFFAEERIKRVYDFYMANKLNIVKRDNLEGVI